MDVGVGTVKENLMEQYESEQRTVRKGEYVLAAFHRHLLTW